MTKQKGICEECKVEYENEYNPKFPRKYCPECSAKKKAEFEGRTPEVGDKIQAHGMAMGKTEFPVVRPGEPVIAKVENSVVKSLRGPYDKDPVGLAVELMCADKDMMAETAINIIKILQKELS